MVAVSALVHGDTMGVGAVALATLCRPPEQMPKSGRPAFSQLFLFPLLSRLSALNGLGGMV